MAVKIALGHDVLQSNHIAMLDVLDLAIDMCRRRLIAHCARLANLPLVVVVLEGVACNLLLLGSIGVLVRMGVKQAAAIAKVLERDIGAKRDFQWILSERASVQSCLEKRPHVGITGPTVAENVEMSGKAGHVNGQWHCNQTYATGKPV